MAYPTPLPPSNLIYFNVLLVINITSLFKHLMKLLLYFNKFKLKDDREEARKVETCITMETCREGSCQTHADVQFWKNQADRAAVLKGCLFPRSLEGFYCTCEILTLVVPGSNMLFLYPTLTHCFISLQVHGTRYYNPEEDAALGSL